MGNLNEVQALQLKIAKTYVDVCDKNNIPYFMTGGTMLGAIRHKGFVPWDDDMDFGMTRDNFERFLKIGQSELGEEFFVQTWETDPGYGLPFAKIRLNGTEYVEKSSEKANMNKGIYIDVFPWDNMPDDEQLRAKQWKKVHIFWHLLMNKCNYDYINKSNFIKKVAAIVLKILSKLIPLEIIHKNLYKNLTMYRNIDTKNAANFCEGNTMEKETWKHSWYTEFDEYEFEGYKFKGPKEYDDFLTHLFGDYMTPVPKSERHKGHGIIKINLGQYGKKD